MNLRQLKPRHALMGIALAGAALLVAFGDHTPASDVAEPAERAAPRVAVLAPAAAPPVAPTTAAATDKDPQIIALVPRAALIGDADTQFAQDGAAVFAHQDWTPPPPPPTPAPPPPPPAAPPLPFTVIGKSVGDGAWEVYLARGERTYVVKEIGAVLDGTYRVDAIAPPLLKLTYLPLHQQQQLNIGVFD